MRKDGCFNNKTDIKIFILFLLDGINCPVDYTTLNNIIIESGYVGSFDFAESFSELTELGHVIEEKNENESYYMISDSGRAVAYELRGSILESIREKSSMIAAKLISLRKNDIKTKVTVNEGEDKRIHLDAIMSDYAGELFRFSLRLSSMSEAMRIKEKFTTSPDEVYRAFMSMATGQIDYYIK